MYGLRLLIKVVWIAFLILFGIPFAIALLAYIGVAGTIASISVFIISLIISLHADSRKQEELRYQRAVEKQMERINAEREPKPFLTGKITYTSHTGRERKIADINVKFKD